jgi:ubiquitin-conjugating enzyme E2 T
MQNLTAEWVKDVRELLRNPLPGTTLEYDGNFLETLIFHLNIPPEYPKEVEEINLIVSFQEGYPKNPPKCWFDPPLYHPNVNQNGRICHPVTNSASGWQQYCQNLTSLVLLAQALICESNPDNPLNSKAADEFKELLAKRK